MRSGKKNAWYWQFIPLCSPKEPCSVLLAYSPNLQHYISNKQTYYKSEILCKYVLGNMNWHINQAALIVLLNQHHLATGLLPPDKAAIAFPRNEIETLRQPGAWSAKWRPSKGYIRLRRCTKLYFCILRACSWVCQRYAEQDFRYGSSLYMRLPHSCNNRCGGFHVVPS